MPKQPLKKQPRKNPPVVSAGDSPMPVGVILPFGASIDNAHPVPAGWLRCDGTAISRQAYPLLYQAIGDLWGAGDGVTSFNVPDLRGYFLRGHNDGQGVDKDPASRVNHAGTAILGDVVGSYQADAFYQHSHPISQRVSCDRGNTNDNLYNVTVVNRYGMIDTITATTVGGNETRPVNASVEYIIRY
jgi:microcystin-dependent protein